MPEYPTVIDPARVMQSLDAVLESSIATGGEPGVQSYVRFLQFIENYLKSSSNAPKDLDLKEEFESALKRQLQNPQLANKKYSEIKAKIRQTIERDEPGQFS